MFTFFLNEFPQHLIIVVVRYDIAANPPVKREIQKEKSYLYTSERNEREKKAQRNVFHLY
jgi:hypothetical protein